MSVFVANLKQNGYLDNLHFTVFNVGSRKHNVEDDYANQGWHLFAPNLSIYGFDADADACEEANKKLQNGSVNWQEEHIPIALSDSIGEAPLYVTKHPMCTSLYPPNEEYLARFPGLPELVNLDFSVDIETTTLDAFCQEEKINNVDFLQIDVQGADLNVLKGATQLLNRSVLAIQIEVEFSHLYVNQPLFADVDSFLSDYQFTLFDLFSTRHFRYSLNKRSNAHPNGQILWADAFYLRDLISEKFPKESQKPARILKLACVADVMGFYDYAVELLVYLTKHYGQDEKYNFTYLIGFALDQ